MTFPRPEKEFLLKVRKGEVPFKEVSEMVEQELLLVEEAQTKSTLPEKPNLEFRDVFLYEFYSEVVKNA